jgi:L-threonylcarbamoyladenylate synthase
MILTRIVSADDPRAVHQALAVLRAGGLVAFPTDTVYGLGALAFNDQAVERLFQAKERAASKAIAVLIGEIGQLSLVSGQVSPVALTLAQHYWPGALTLVVVSHPDLPNNLSPQPTIGVRMPDHLFAQALLRRAGPLATTSANLSGGANPRNAQDVLAQLEGRVELVIDGGDAPGGIPSTVVDCTQDLPKILREGAIKEEAICALFPRD